MKKIVLAGLVVILGFCSWSAYRFMMGEPIRNVLETIPAPDQSKTAILLRSSRGGATVGFSYYVAISAGEIDAGSIPDFEETWIWKSYRVGPIDVRWQDSRKIEVLVSSSDEAYSDTIETREFQGVTAETRMDR